MKYVKGFVILALGFLMSFQAPDSIDGVPIRSLLRGDGLRARTGGKALFTDAQVEASLGTCAGYQKAIAAAVYEREVKEFGITVTPAEVAARVAELAAMVTPEKLQAAEKMLLIPPALAKVYDQHADPQQVYREDLQSHGVSLEEWQGFLSRPDGKTQEGRTHITQQYQQALDTLQNPGAAADKRQLEVEGQKLNAAIDQKLAAGDAAFAAHLRDYQAAFASAKVETSGLWAGGRGYSFSMDKMGYLNQKREEFRRAETAKLDVRLSDRTIKAKCGLAGMGVQ